MTLAKGGENSYMVERKINAKCVGTTTRSNYTTQIKRGG
jgi:hypothetical protein